MAKDILVNEGSSLKVIKGVEKLITKLPDDTTVDWIAEDEARLVTKTIVQDGTYIASQEIGKPYGYSEVTVSGAGNQVIGQTAIKNVTENGIYEANKDTAGPFYGYSKVVVNVSTSMAGTSGTVGKDSNGNDAMAVVNSETGKIEIETLPEALVISLAPLKNAYYDGQSIDLSGIHAVAVDGNDQPWTGGGRYPDGIIPVSELILPVNTAYYDEQYEEAVVSSDELSTGGVNSFPLTSGNYVLQNPIKGTLEYSITGGERNTVFYNFVDVFYYLQASANPYTEHYRSWTTQGGEYTGTYQTTSYTYAGKTVYCASTGGFSEWPVSSSTINANYIRVSNDFDWRIAAWILIYGAVTYLPIQQDVAVQWRRPGDGKILSDEFAILVSKTT